MAQQSRKCPSNENISYSSVRSCPIRRETENITVCRSKSFLETGTSSLLREQKQFIEKDHPCGERCPKLKPTTSTETSELHEFLCTDRRRIPSLQYFYSIQRSGSVDRTITLRIVPDMVVKTSFRFLHRSFVSTHRRRTCFRPLWPARSDVGDQLLSVSDGLNCPMLADIVNNSPGLVMALVDSRRKRFPVSPITVSDVAHRRRTNDTTRTDCGSLLCRSWTRPCRSFHLR